MSEKTKPTVENGIIRLVKFDDKNVELFVKVKKETDEGLSEAWKSYGYHRTVHAALRYGLEKDLFVTDFKSYESAVSWRKAIDTYKEECKQIFINVARQGKHFWEDVL